MNGRNVLHVEKNAKNVKSFFRRYLLILVGFMVCSSTSLAQDETVNGNLNVTGNFWQYSSFPFRVGRSNTDSNQGGYTLGYWDYTTNAWITQGGPKPTNWRWDQVDENGNGQYQMMLTAYNELIIYPRYPNHSDGSIDYHQIELNPDRDYPFIRLNGMIIQYHEPGNGSGFVRFNTGPYAANWTWGTDSYGSVMSRKQMELNVENSLVMYDADEPNQASIIISPRRTYLPTPYIAIDGKKVLTEEQNTSVRFNSTVRLTPQGDLTMGEFTAEPQQ